MTIAPVPKDRYDAVASFQWDLETIQELHGSLSHEMQKETAEVTAFS